MHISYTSFTNITCCEMRNSNNPLRLATQQGHRHGDLLALLDGDLLDFAVKHGEISWDLGREPEKNPRKTHGKMGKT